VLVLNDAPLLDPSLPPDDVLIPVVRFVRDEEYKELCDRLAQEHRELLRQLGYPVPPEGSGASTGRERKRKTVVMR